MPGCLHIAMQCASTAVHWRCQIRGQAGMLARLGEGLRPPAIDIEPSAKLPELFQLVQKRCCLLSLKLWKTLQMVCRCWRMMESPGSGCVEHSPAHPAGHRWMYCSFVEPISDACGDPKAMHDPHSSSSFREFLFDLRHSPLPTGS